MSNKDKLELSLLNATSADTVHGKTHVVLYWSLRYDVVGYNLYRSKTVSIPARAKPINGRKLIAPVTTCLELKKIIPQGSDEWQSLTDAFTSVHKRKELVMEKSTFNRAVFSDRNFLSTLERAPTLPKDFIPISPAGVRWEVDPCTAMDRGLTEEEEHVFDALTGCSLNYRLAGGLAFLDHSVENNQKYFYELRGVRKDRKEIVLGTKFIVAGVFALPHPPSGFALSSGDSKVLALWNRNPQTFSYTICRSGHPAIGYKLINDEKIQLDITHDLNGDELVDPKPGFVDFCRWDEDGMPISHEVNGTSIGGPINEIKYYYKVAGVDILGRQGLWSNYKSAVPVSSITPKAPETLTVVSSNSPRGLTLSWQKVVFNAENHRILDTSQIYKIYRADTLGALEDIASLAAYEVATISANPSDTTITTITWTDTNPVLSPDYGEKDFWYRVCCIDLHANKSAPSAAVSGRLPDITAPGPTKLEGAEGFSDHINIRWYPNLEPDLAGYQIYRAICDHGVVYEPDKEKQRCDMVLVGSVGLGEAKSCLEAEGVVYFDDFSVPTDSPLCYAYWVRAYDASQNLYMGHNGCPYPDEYICQRLLEETPPPAPIITGLRARNNSVFVEWIASPIQDLRAFHVYRSENEDDVGSFIGCILSDGTPYPNRWEGVKPACSEIPAEPNPTSVKGQFLDKNTDPKRTYWYRVSALDWLGNESDADDLSRIPAISTFTYSADLPAKPDMIPQTTTTSSGCGLNVSWSPAFVAEQMMGFVVFRSTHSLKGYRQVSPIVKTNVYTDSSACRGVDYYYKVQTIDHAGKLSIPSNPREYSY